ncbi:lymphocyte antigen 6E [Trichosurus vulpecula]|uniref:lymphocyte antigen 6E n=1 Tax=Trichosurus vulpecula TaxID=9337 RepID=UPI00186AC2CF|nr:lymphocyte antigen 6E [Trichosurus vulpecula]
MKVFVLVLLASLLYVERAHALMCFSCNKKRSNFGCLKISFCTVDEPYCVSQTISTATGHKSKSISKYCSATCPITFASGVVVMATRCCQHSLCNIFSNDGGLQASSLVLGLSVLFSLLYAVVRPGA